MKQIKLSDYSLINVKELDERIEELKKESREANDANIEIIRNSQYIILEEIKQSLITSEKLAEVAFDKGEIRGFRMNHHDCPIELISTKQEFLNSEINLD